MVEKKNITNMGMSKMVIKVDEIAKSAINTVAAMATAKRKNSSSTW